MTYQELLARFGVALLAGLGAGLERGYRQRALAEGQRAMGVRTFGFISLAGAAGAFIAPLMGPWLLITGGLALAGLLVAAYRAESTQTHDLGLTTEVAALAIYAAGAMAGSGLLLPAALIGVVTIAMLHAKSELHALVAGLRHDEIHAGIKVLGIAIVLLPLTPDEGVGPGGVVNFHSLLWAIVVIASTGVAGHVALRTLGPQRGALAMGFFGGLVSSTAVTISASALARTSPAQASRLAAAVSVAQAVMFGRTLGLIWVLNRDVFWAAGPALGAGLATAILFAAWLVRTPVDALEALEPGPPDMLMRALEFAALTTVVLIAGSAATRAFGVAGFYLGCLFAGLVDVDAGTLAAARLSHLIDAPAAAGAFALLLAVSANCIAKTVISARLGGPSMGRQAGVAILASGASSMAMLAAAFAIA